MELSREASYVLLWGASCSSCDSHAQMKVISTVSAKRGVLV